MKRNSVVTDGCPRHAGEAAWGTVFHLAGMGTWFHALASRSP